MPELLTPVLAYLAANVWLKWLLLELGLFLLTLSVRKFWPTLWLRFETLSPFAEPGPVLDALHKAFQALPTLLLSTVLPALVTGGDWKAAAWGAVLGVLPPLSHELAKWAPFLPYHGELGAVKSGTKLSGKGKVRLPPILSLMLVVGLMALPGCAGWKPVARTADGVAETLCALFFAEQKPGLTLEDAARQFCATHEDLKPWIEQVLAAKASAGKAALASP